VLSGFRDFLIRLRDESPERFELFRQPRPELPIVDLLPILDRLVG
jgi:hypothetical protein